MSRALCEDGFGLCPLWGLPAGPPCHSWAPWHPSRVQAQPTKTDGEMDSADLEITPSPPPLWEVRGQIQGRDLRCLQRSSCQVWEKTGIQMVILIFHLANWSPSLLSGALSLLAPQSFALKLARSTVREREADQSSGAAKPSGKTNPERSWAPRQL